MWRSAAASGAHGSQSGIVLEFTRAFGLELPIVSKQDLKVHGGTRDQDFFRYALLSQRISFHSN